MVNVTKHQVFWKSPETRLIWLSPIHAFTSALLTIEPAVETVYSKPVPTDTEIIMRKNAKTFKLTIYKKNGKPFAKFFIPLNSTLR